MYIYVVCTIKKHKSESKDSKEKGHPKMENSAWWNTEENIFDPNEIHELRKIENWNDFLKWAALLIKHFQREQNQSFIIFNFPLRCLWRTPGALKENMPSKWRFF